jgi:hypothetical protein
MADVLQEFLFLYIFIIFQYIRFISLDCTVSGIKTGAGIVSLMRTIFNPSVSLKLDCEFAILATIGQVGWVCVETIPVWRP